MQKYLSILKRHKIIAKDKNFNEVSLEKLFENFNELEFNKTFANPKSNAQLKLLELFKLDCILFLNDFCLSNKIHYTKNLFKILLNQFNLKFFKEISQELKFGEGEFFEVQQNINSIDDFIPIELKPEFLKLNLIFKIGTDNLQVEFNSHEYDLQVIRTLTDAWLFEFYKVPTRIKLSERFWLCENLETSILEQNSRDFNFGLLSTIWTKKPTRLFHLFTRF